jgi:hypothetical protein
MGGVEPPSHRPRTHHGDVVPPGRGGVSNDRRQLDHPITTLRCRCHHRFRCRPSGGAGHPSNVHGRDGGDGVGQAWTRPGAAAPGRRSGAGPPPRERPGGWWSHWTSRSRGSRSAARIPSGPTGRPWRRRSGGGTSIPRRRAHRPPPLTGPREFPVGPALDRVNPPQPVQPEYARLIRGVIHRPDRLGSAQPWNHLVHRGVHRDVDPPRRPAARPGHPELPERGAPPGDPEPPATGPRPPRPSPIGKSPARYAATGFRFQVGTHRDPGPRRGASPGVEGVPGRWRFDRPGRPGDRSRLTGGQVRATAWALSGP